MDIENLNESGMSCTYRNDTVSFCKECCLVCFYVVCFSVRKQVGFWNEEMLDAFIERGKQVYGELKLKECCMFANLPNVVKIDVAKVKVSFNVFCQGTVANKELLVGIEKIEEVIKANEVNNTAFFMCMSELYISCIFKRSVGGKISYAVFVRFGKESAVLSQIRLLCVKYMLSERAERRPDSPSCRVTF